MSCCIEAFIWNGSEGIYGFEKSRIYETLPILQCSLSIFFLFPINSQVCSILCFPFRSLVCISISSLLCVIFVAFWATLRHQKEINWSLWHMVTCLCIWYTDPEFFSFIYFSLLTLEIWMPILYHFSKPLCILHAWPNCSWITFLMWYALSECKYLVISCFMFVKIAACLCYLHQIFNFIYISCKCLSYNFCVHW